MVAGRALLLRWTPAAKAPHHLRAPPVPCLSTAPSSSREAGGGRRGTSSCSAICCSCPIPSMCMCSCHDHEITLPVTLPIRRQDTFFFLPMFWSFLRSTGACGGLVLCHAPPPPAEDIIGNVTGSVSLAWDLQTNDKNKRGNYRLWLVLLIESRWGMWRRWECIREG